MLEWGPILQKGAEALTSALTKSALEKADAAFKNRTPYSVLDFQPHIRFAFKRCTEIKTVLSRDVPVSLLEQYVNLNYKNGDEVIDDFELIERVWTQKRVLVISTGGGGKSMFMRYLWVSCSVNPRGKIPIYVELRRLNDIEGSDFDTFLFRTVTATADPKAHELFKGGLRAGQFILILDGFDEIQLDKRDAIEAKLLALANENPDTAIVVSGRPEDRYNGWQSFFTYTVRPLSREQTISLIERVEFKEDTKSKFLKKLKRGEFEQHRSFLQLPLLATMMLLMFEYFADVPDKMHLFYDHAFEALFHIHDGLKESFKRKMSSQYAPDVFKRYLGYFCLITYNTEKLSFTRTELLEFVRKAGKLDGTEIDAENFARDLQESVCVLQDDGLHKAFSHRSFQEYFCAYALSKMPSERVRPLLIRFARKVEDSVVPMLYDMNKSLVEDELLLPVLSECEQVLAKPSAVKDLSAFLHVTKSSIKIMALCDQRRTFAVSFYIESAYDFVSLRTTLSKLLGHRPMEKEPPFELVEEIVHVLSDADKVIKGRAYGVIVSGAEIKAQRLTPKRGGGIYALGKRFFDSEFDDTIHSADIELNENAYETILGVLKSSRQANDFQEQVLRLRRAASKIRASVSKRDKTIDDLLKL